MFQRSTFGQPDPDFASTRFFRTPDVYGNASITVKELLPISNAREQEARHNRFLIGPTDMLRGERHARSAGLDIVGIYHSHPDHPARPSQFDLDHAWPVFSYIIVSVTASGAGEMLSWELREDRSGFDAERIE